ncbi:LLM class flavin-dependent oxidoreductase [Pseudoalteromonas luteoviolacea]|uniref:MupA/Atu3671 family FMN-dependent luciferase-like monooxygenase n=1 Tax=Pseudoalteromonas luteoviolacea TaxID=43657 RepID=UPI001F45F592|nr:MupA/Atu3671 family FMN-dependent luciferase-like monooxygenase [Pseudoalteromonas luteoviolacea]MCF6437888.1 LLM class flavin-dependent oxidoreductase [Pseudoalteromonas luteoviolacea]
MDLNNILTMCAHQEIALEVNDGELELFFDEYPSDELVQLIRDNKPALIEFLTQKQSRLQQSMKMMPVVPRSESTDSHPLSFSQRRIWFVEELEQKSAQFAMPAIFEFEGEIDEKLVKLTLQAITQRHEILRTIYKKDAFGEPVQHIMAEVDVTLEIEEVKESADIAKSINQFIYEETDISLSHPLRTRIIKTGPQSGLLMFVVHHIAADGISLNILLSEFVEQYRNSVDNKEQIADLPVVQYADYAIWQREGFESGLFGQQMAYWEQTLDNLPVIHSIPTDFERPPRPSFEGGVVNIELPKETVTQIQRICREYKLSTFMVLFSAYAVLQGKYANQTDVVIGTPFANRIRPELEPLIGLFVNNMVLRCNLQPEQSLVNLLEEVKKMVVDAEEHSDVPFEILVENLNPQRSTAFSPLFQIFFTMNTVEEIDAGIEGLSFKPVDIQDKPIRYDLTLAATESASGITLNFEFSKDLFASTTIERFANNYVEFLRQALCAPTAPIAQHSVMSEQELAFLTSCSGVHDVQESDNVTVPELLFSALRSHPEKPVLIGAHSTLSAQQLIHKVEQNAYYLAEHGVSAGSRVAIALERSTDMLCWVIAVLKVGGCYVPLDKSMPVERISYIIEDAKVDFILEDGSFDDIEGATKLTVGPAITEIDLNDISWPQVNAQDLAYIIYTSGTTGKPKGTRVTHKNVCSFLQAMEPVISKSVTHDGLWLSTTPLAFDISVLEMFGALSFGIPLMIAPDQRLSEESYTETAEFSLFFFGCAAQQRQENIYDLMLSSADYADKNGYKAIWTPERHFGEFGGLFPNPSVTCAAIAARTKHIEVRAGSCVLPLNDTLRIAEDWAVIDNLSNGRAGVSFASGWHPADFVLNPTHFENRHQVMYESIDTFKQLWQGQSIQRRDPAGTMIDVQVYPKPVQKQLPIWLTAAGSPKTFEDAGRLGTNVLTHLLGQTISELEEKIAIYHQAWQQAGHAGKGKVTVMVHTFIGQEYERVMQTVKEPFKAYLSSSLALIEQVKNEVFEAQAVEDIDDDALLDMAFERYASTAALFGTVESCAPMVQKLIQAGVDEFGCLIDFGVETPDALEGLKQLTKLKAKFEQQAESSLAELLEDRQVSHVQCTPSMATLLLADPKIKSKLSTLEQIFVGGEVLTQELAAQLHSLSDAQLFNMYGPTETTVWVTHGEVKEETNITIGKVLTHAKSYIVDAQRKLVPWGAKGELMIAGPCVSDGYEGNLALQQSRFIDDPYSTSGKAYLTGDLVKLDQNGELCFLGRLDDQIKLRGFRIELAEIDSQIESVRHVEQCATALVGEKADEHRLVAFYTSTAESQDLEEEIKRCLQSKLPDYMLPTAYVRVDAIPMTTSGKKDRKALTLNFSISFTQQLVLPESDTEQAIATIWCELLKVEQVGVTTSFFEQGGHSLLLAKLQTCLNEKYDLSLPIRVVFERNTIRQQAELIDGYLLKDAEFSEDTDLVVETI